MRQLDSKSGTEIVNRAKKSARARKIFSTHQVLPDLAPKLLASDLDGTLLDESGLVPAEVSRAIELAKENELEFRIVTARPPRWLHRVRELSAANAILCANGAFVYDPETNQVIENRGFSFELVQEIAERLTGIPGLGMSAELVDGFWRDPNFPSLAPNGESDDDCLRQIAPLSELTLAQGKVGKLLAVSKLPSQLFLAEISRRLEGLAVLQLSTATGLAELSPPGIDKASSLACEAEKIGISAANCWSIGDMPNDLPMLNWARVGFAVRNAPDYVQIKANAIAPANSEAAVAKVIYQALELRDRN